MSARAGLFVERERVIFTPAAVPDGIRLVTGAAATMHRMTQRNVAVIGFSAMRERASDEMKQKVHGLLEAEKVSLVTNLFAAASEPKALAKSLTGMVLWAAKQHLIDLFQSWLITANPALLPVAANAGLQGAVLVGGAPLPADDLGIVVAEARDLADAPRVMIPKGGGCWHT
jgi:histidinol phosphatase-like enzyme